MSTLLLTLHSTVRYLVLGAAVVNIVYLLIALAGARGFGRPARILTAVYLGCLDLQALLGILVYLTIKGYPALIGHVAMMLTALTVAHVTSVLNKRREKPSCGLALVGVAVSLLLIVGGILAINRPIIGRAPTS